MRAVASLSLLLLLSLLLHVLLASQCNQVLQRKKLVLPIYLKVCLLGLSMLKRHMRLQGGWRRPTFFQFLVFIIFVLFILIELLRFELWR